PEIWVTDGGGVGDQPPLEARPGFRGGQRLGVKLVAPQARVERLWGGEQRFKAFAAAGVDDVIRVLARRQLDEAQGPVGTEKGERASGGADRRLAAGIVAVEAEDRRRIEAPQPLELAFREGGAVGRDYLRDAGAVERDHVHIAF